MPPVVLLRPMYSPKWDITGLRSALRDACRQEGTEIKIALMRTTNTWKDKPTFRKDVIYTVDQIGVVVQPNPDDKMGQVWGYLDQGTRIRWAVMSPGFQPKTRNRWFGSGRGRGGAVIVGKRAMMRRNIAPRPGIRARNWSEAVHDMRTQPFRRRIQREFNLWAADAQKKKGGR